MTGFAEEEVLLAGGRYLLILSSTNKRFFEVQVSLPRELAFLEAMIRAGLQSKIHRGAISMRVVMEAPAAVLNMAEAMVEGAHRTLSRLSEKLQLKRDYSVLELFSFLKEMNLDKESSGGVEEAFQEAFDRLVASFLAMKEEEGASLVLDLKERNRRIIALIGEIETRSPADRAAVEKRLLEKVASLATQVSQEDRDRILREAAFMCEKADITEELVRLRSHTRQFETGLSGESGGKKLEFLLQEMGREATTILSKSQNTEITYLGIGIKEELEKQREQVCNIE
ncbi:MAG: hypothetical protein A3F09_01175 [Chlamydiae bacterium RIFCSPHIGHO2_12_FULL_49_11]|nr:MAG: hypothetical protein A3F09_01175 [Chlamydiae bacterium RIFCSPHIGHO2_12_FULL_49_11]